VSVTFKIVSDDPGHEICYGLALLFNSDEAVQINPTLTISRLILAYLAIYSLFHNG
jgi:hypothetical protein